ncbi:MAG: phosphoribosylformylglycinamidine synthase subunit PurQ [Actinomycetota bacterium]
MSGRKVGIVVFPGSNCEQDVALALSHLGAANEYIWHLEKDVSSFDAVVLPGGFSYGDYLRTGAIAAFSPIMASVKEFAASGKPVIGICNGFQILCESGLLPGALRRNSGLKFRCMSTQVTVAAPGGVYFSNAGKGEVLTMPINHFEGNYYCSGQTLDRLRSGGRIALRYCDAEGRATPESNPNGAIDNIAGILSDQGNVLGLMPHPERAVDPQVGGVDGAVIFRSMLESMLQAV